MVIHASCIVNLITNVNMKYTLTIYVNSNLNFE